MLYVMLGIQFWRSKMRKKKLLLKATIFISTLVFVFGCYIGCSIYFFSKQNTIAEADVALVFGASLYKDEPSPVFAERINHGIWLYKEGYVSKILISGGNEHYGNIEAEMARNYAKEKGIPEKDILIETKSRNTEENIVYSKDIILENGFQKVIMVSDPLHMKRIMKISEYYGLNAISSPTPTSKYQRWDKKIKFLVLEVIKYSKYLIFGRKSSHDV